MLGSETISKGQIDRSVIIGIVVVLAIVSAAGFGIYYFGIMKPRQEELQRAKKSALRTLEDELEPINTNQADQATKNYEAKIEGAETKSKVTNIASDMDTVIERESTREELMTIVKNGTQGPFYPHALDEIYNNLREEVKAESTISGLKTLRNTIEKQLTEAWTDIHKQAIENISDKTVVMLKKNSDISEVNMTKENALEYVNEKKWRTLQGLQFREINSFMVPIIQEFKRVPSVDPGDRVDIYEYNSEEDKMNERVTNTEVLNVIYPKDILSSISWSKREGDQSYSYSTELWEEIKAEKAGAAGAKSKWDDWARSVIQAAREEANLGDFDLKPIYVVQITGDNVARDLMHIEQFQNGTRDIVLVARK